MIHLCHPVDSAGDSKIVSLDSSMDRRPRNPHLVLLIQSLELILGSVEQDSQVVAIHSEFAAYGVFVLFFQEDSAQQVPVLWGHFLEDLAHALRNLPGDEHTLQV